MPDPHNDKKEQTATKPSSADVKNQNKEESNPYISMALQAIIEGGATYLTNYIAKKSSVLGRLQGFSTELSPKEAAQEMLSRYPEQVAKTKARDQRYQAYENELLKDMPKVGFVIPSVAVGCKIAATIGFAIQDEEPASQQIKDHRPPTAAKGPKK